MIGFGIDQVQAEYVAEIKLRNINKEYILKRTQEIEASGTRKLPIWRRLLGKREADPRHHHAGAGRRCRRNTAQTAARPAADL